MTMEILKCDACGADLEPSQIGLCDACQGPTNEDRRQRACDVLDFYSDRKGERRDEADMRDLLADLMHLAHKEPDDAGEPFAAALAGARMNFLAEIEPDTSDIPETPAASFETAKLTRPAHLDSREMATVLAALHYWQGGRGLKVAPFRDVATDCGEFEPLTVAEIDSLCERINTHAPTPTRAPDFVLTAFAALLPEVDSEIDSRRFSGNAEDWRELLKLYSAAKIALDIATAAPAVPPADCSTNWEVIARKLHFQLGLNLEAWEDEEDSVKEEHADLMTDTEQLHALAATFL